MRDGLNPEIIFEDNKILVAVKPPGILSQSDFTSRPDILTLLKDFIKQRDTKPGNVFLGLVHRLDREVGGVMVFAKNSKAAKKLSQSIRDHSFKKNYIALVEGNAMPAQGHLEDYILKNSKTNKSEVVTKEVVGAKLCSLNYKVLKQKNNKYLIEIELLTGRSHQIRLQFSSRGFPLVGDAKYKSTSKLNTSDIALWAYKVSFPSLQPDDQKILTFTSDPPFNI